MHLSGLQKASIWGNVRFILYCYIDYAQPLNLSPPSHTTPIEFTLIDYHLVEDPSQKTVVNLGSRIPSLALDTTLAPENPRTN